MKSKKAKRAGLLLLFFGVTTLQAQQTTDATGGDAFGIGGSVAYSVGQIVYTTNSSITGSEAQGVQQPYEISIVLELGESLMGIDLQVYPNPTNNFLTLNLEKNELSNLSFQMFDANGKVIESKKITSPTETICMENLPSAMYFLKITNSKEIKTYKIIKN